MIIRMHFSARKMSQEKVQFRFPSSKKKISAQVQGFGSLDDREVEESKNKEDHEEVSVRVLRFKEEGNTLADQGNGIIFLVQQFRD